MSKKVSKKTQRRRDGEVGTDFSLSGRVGILILFSLFLSGGAALVYEVLWLHLITLFSRYTTVVTAAVLTAFMAGLALGAFLGWRAADRLAPPRIRTACHISRKISRTIAWRGGSVVVSSLRSQHTWGRSRNDPGRLRAIAKPRFNQKFNLCRSS